MAFSTCSYLYQVTTSDFQPWDCSNRLIEGESYTTHPVCCRDGSMTSLDGAPWRSCAALMGFLEPLQACAICRMPGRRIGSESRLIDPSRCQYLCLCCSQNPQERKRQLDQVGLLSPITCLYSLFQSMACFILLAQRLLYWIYLSLLSSSISLTCAIYRDNLLIVS